MQIHDAGSPPNSKSIRIGASETPVPEPLGSELRSKLESAGGTGRVVFGFDADAGILAISDGKTETWKRMGDLKRIFLWPLLPAKGHGLLDLSWSQERGDDLIMVDRYSDPMRDWLRAIGVSMAGMAGCNFEESEDKVYDC